MLRSFCHGPDVGVETGAPSHSLSRCVPLFHVDRNAARLWKAIGNHLEFLAAQANALAGTVSEALDAGTNFRNRGRYIRMTRHSLTILRPVARWNARR
jgi:hypothetical protein